MFPPYSLAGVFIAALLSLCCTNTCFIHLKEHTRSCKCWQVYTLHAAKVISFCSVCVCCLWVSRCAAFQADSYDNMEEQGLFGHRAPRFVL